MVSSTAAWRSTQQLKDPSEPLSSFLGAPFLLNLTRSSAERMSGPFTLCVCVLMPHGHFGRALVGLAARWVGGVGVVGVGG